VEKGGVLYLILNILLFLEGEDWETNYLDEQNEEKVAYFGHYMGEKVVEG